LVHTLNVILDSNNKMNCDIMVFAVVLERFYAGL